MHISGWRVTGIVAICLLCMCVWVILANGFNEPSVGLLIRDTARVSVTLFTLAFTASSLHLLAGRPWTGWLLHNRRYIGVSFAVAHGAHLLAIVTLFSAFPRVTDQYPGGGTLVGGGIAYGFIALMALTSLDRTAALIGPKTWRVLHTTGSYYIWLLFALSYVPRAVDEPWYIPFGLLIVAAPLIRFFGWREARLKRQAAPAATA